ncbi:MAG: hypothetical protein Q4C91_06135 [Eubacteriales bacterium]|nr:hypothetical protein [Eubacteriales bacterium]
MGGKNIRYQDGLMAAMKLEFGQADLESDLYQDSLMRSTMDIVTDMHLVGGPSEMIKPLNVGLMFFNERPDNRKLVSKRYRNRFIGEIQNDKPVSNGAKTKQKRRSKNE